jgi:aconitate hydratase
MPLTFVDENDYNKIDKADILEIHDIQELIATGEELNIQNKTKGYSFFVCCTLYIRQILIILAGGAFNIRKIA